MIIDHRTYNMTHGKMEDYLRRYETIGLPLQKAHLGRLVGFFVSDIGPLNQVVHLWAYDSIADREIRRERMAADPRWQNFREGNHGMFASQEIKILKPTSFSPLR
jgi:NIPSNAP